MERDDREVYQWREMPAATETLKLSVNPTIGI
jgi:hypothetical protein